MNATDGLLLATRDIAKELKTGIHMVFSSSCILNFSTIHYGLWTLS